MHIRKHIMLPHLDTPGNPGVSRLRQARFHVAAPARRTAAPIRRHTFPDGVMAHWPIARGFSPYCTTNGTCWLTTSG